MNTNTYTPSGAVIYTPERTKALLARRGTSPRTQVITASA